MIVGVAGIFRVRFSNKTNHGLVLVAVFISFCNVLSIHQFQIVTHR